ncbi:MAG: MazG-like family protein [Bacillota bacterium]|nr:MazG-like family protein [Bacillota bacterium]
MGLPGLEFDVARNLRTIEWLKAELLNGLSVLFKGMLKGNDDSILEALANLVMCCYLLGQRLGVSFSRLDHKIQNKVEANIRRSHEIEQWYGDFSALKAYLKEKEGAVGAR